MGLFDFFRSKRPDPQPEEEAYVVPDTVPVMPVNRRVRPRVNARHGTQALIIDDSPTIVAALGKMLRSVNYVVYEAGSAEDGLELARREMPQLIFLDIVLPGMNGFSALRAIRRDADLRDTPVIMMSGNEQATEQFFGSRIGADDFMKKPFSRQEVFAHIERLLDINRIPRRIVVPNVIGDPGLTTTQLAPPLPGTSQG